MKESSDWSQREHSTVQPVAWVTGSGAPRVGQQIAREFANAGYRIVLHAYRSLDEAERFALELNHKGIETLIVEGAVDDERFATLAVEQILERFGQLDVCVNSAAVWHGKSLEETTPKDLRQQFEVNALGTFLCSQQAGLAMVRQMQGGAIVLIGDWAVLRPYRDFSGYFLSKGSIETMTRSLAVELATRNPRIRVNAILPGPVMLDASISEARTSQITNDCLLKRLGTAEDVSRAALFLAQQPFITGVCLPVDGGRSIHAAYGSDSLAHPDYQPEN